MVYNIVVETYEGPMDLLLDLIKKNEIDIYDIPIFEITEQFLDYLEKANEINMELTADFILMASTLLEIKSKMLIPKISFDESSEEDEEDDPRSELVQKLLEYEKYKNISELLKESEEYEKKAFYKVREEFETINDLDLLKNCDISSLSKAFLNILKQNKNRQITSIYRDQFSVEEGMNIIRKELLKKGSISFSELIEEDTVRLEIITYFLSMLELIKIGLISAKQKNQNQDIFIKLRAVET